jgi:hypothetical protein
MYMYTYMYMYINVYGKRQLPFVFCKRKQLGRQTINGNRRLLFQQTCPSMPIYPGSVLQSSEPISVCKSKVQGKKTPWNSWAWEWVGWGRGGRESRRESRGIGCWWRWIPPWELSTHPARPAHSTRPVVREGHTVWRVLAHKYNN